MLSKADLFRQRLGDVGWPRRGLVFAVLGALVALGHAPFDLWWMSILGLACAFALMPIASGRSAFWHGWALGAGYFLVSLRWIVSPFLVDLANDGWMAPFALFLMAGGFALFWGAAVAIANRFWQASWIGLPVALTVVEMVRSLILTGFPWALLGQTLLPTPFAQLAAFGGPHMLTLAVALAAAGIATMRIGPAAIAVGAAVIAWPVLTPAPLTLTEDAPIVRLVQPNAPQDQKWDPVMSQFFYERMIGYTAQGDVPDLIVWPESAIAILLNSAGDVLTEMSDMARGAPLIVGVNRAEDGLYYNSFVHLGRGGVIEGFYDKQHLVPFGEYIPGGDLLHRIGIRGFGSSYGGGFTAGQGQKTLQVPGIGVIRPLICYEGIFSEEIGGSDLRPRTMILITNDAWFGKAAGPFQHLAQARLRAIEQGLPMVRVANTGVSAIIDAKGRITGTIALNTEGYLDAPLPPADAPTLYSRAGEWPLGVLLTLLLCALSWHSRQNKVDPFRERP